MYGAVRWVGPLSEALESLQGPWEDSSRGPLDHCTGADLRSSHPNLGNRCLGINARFALLSRVAFLGAFGAYSIQLFLWTRQGVNCGAIIDK